MPIKLSHKAVITFLIMIIIGLILYIFYNNSPHTPNIDNNINKNLSYNIEDYYFNDKYFIHDALIHNFLVIAEQKYNIFKKENIKEYYSLNNKEQKQELARNELEDRMLYYKLIDAEFYEWIYIKYDNTIESCLNEYFLKCLLLTELMEGEEQRISLEKERAQFYAKYVFERLAEDAMNNHEQAVLCTQAYS